MRVSDTSIAATSATLTPHQSIDVTVSQDADFIRMMSTNLYSNQLLAALREPCCNAWDSHIEAGKIDVALKVDLTSDGILTIQDFGVGIPHDRIGKIYGTYGLSTKRNNDGVTGGFGLGSKAPFAAVDSFRVTSCHGGVRNVYNMVGADASKNGMPSINPVVVNVPCGEETGLTLQMHLNEEQTLAAVSYLKSILHTGGMKYELNIMGTLYTSEDSEPFLGSNAGDYSLDPSIDSNYCYSHHGVYIRYGTVIYPVLEEPTTRTSINLLRSFMRILQAHSIVVQAAPGTLGLVPSREAFTRSQLTTDGTVNLCLALVDRIEKEITDEIPSQLAQGLEITSKKALQERMWTKYMGVSLGTIIPNPTVYRYLVSDLYDAKVLADYKRKVHKLYYQEVGSNLRQKLGSRIFSIMKKYANKESWDGNDYLGSLYTHKIVKPTMRKLVPIAKVIGKKDVAIDTTVANGMPILVMQDYLFSTDPTKRLSKTLFVLFTNGRRKKESYQYYPDRHNYTVRVFIRLPKTKEGRQQVKEYLQSENLSVLDLTEKHDWDEPRNREERRRQRELATRPTKKMEHVVYDPVEQKEVVKTYTHIGVSLGFMVSENEGLKTKVRGHAITTDDFNIRHYTHRYYTQGEPCVEPKYFWIHPSAVINAKTFQNEPSDMNLKTEVHHNFYMLSKSELDSTVVVRNYKDWQYAMKLKLIPIHRIVTPRCLDIILSPEFKEYVANEREIHMANRLGYQRKKMFAEMGVKLPKLDKLRYHADYERLITFVKYSHSRIFQVNGYLKDTKYSTEVIKPVIDSLCELYGNPTIPALKILEHIRRDALLRNSNWEHVWYENDGSYKPIISSMIKLAIKLGKQNDKSRSSSTVS